MAFTTHFQVYLFVNLLAPGSCNAVQHEPESLRQGAVGYLESQLILKEVFSDLETDIQILKAEIADTKSKYEGMFIVCFGKAQKGFILAFLVLHQQNIVLIKEKES